MSSTQWSLSPKAFNILDSSAYAIHKRFIIAQSKLETANFTSRLFVQFNNGFGMKNAVKRSQLGQAALGSDFRKYVSFDESVTDFILYLQFVKFPTHKLTAQEYVNELKKRHYFEENESDYLLSLESWL